MKLSIVALVLLTACGSAPQEATATTSAPDSMVSCSGTGPGFEWTFTLDNGTGYAGTASTEAGAVWANGAFEGPSTGAIDYSTDKTEQWSFRWNGSALDISATGPVPVSSFSSVCP